MSHIPMRLFGSPPVADNPVIEMTEPFGAHDTPSMQCMPDQALDGGDEAIGDSTN
jgi:hypothetical protein